VEGLRIETADGRTLVGPNTLTVPRGEVTAIVGESGSGKTLTLRALHDILPPSLVASTAQRWDRPSTAIIFQEPGSYFNPRWRIRRSLGEVLRYVAHVSRTDLPSRIDRLLSRVGLRPEDGTKFPHEMSGGMLQRAAIAIALATEPQLLLADEITSALDPDSRDRILAVLQTVAADERVAVLLVTHDIRAVERVAASVMVLYRGIVVEQGPASTVLSAPRHHYTAALIAALPGDSTRGRQLPEIPPIDAEAGCPFHPACPGATSICRSVMPEWSSGAAYRCHHPRMTDAERELDQDRENRS
jgi:oligopeptide/dipeptide ABC transporter ATP-binding protein